jgi:hypothetical protein
MVMFKRLKKGHQLMPFFVFIVSEMFALVINFVSSNNFLSKT